MARKFPGKNSITSAKDLWLLRAKYKVQAYIEGRGDGGPEVKDLNFFERTYYGCIDQRDQSITPNPDFLKPLKAVRSLGSTPVALDFVVDMFQDVNRAFINACNAGFLRKDTNYLSNLEAVRAYKSPRAAYEKYLNTLLMKMNTQIIPKRYDMKNILSFDDYVKVFLNFYSSNLNQVPLTLTKWCRSYYSSVFNSGLAVDITGLPIGDDQPKIDLFLDASSYGYYRDVAINKGFSVMKNAPWILIADLQSPAITPYLSSSKYRIKNLTDLFNKRYIKTNTYERDILQESFYLYYNLFTIQYPRTKIIRTCNKKTVVSYITRTRLNRRQYYATYSPDYWIDILVQLKNSEENAGYSPQKIYSIQNNAKKIYNSLDNLRAAAYIEREYGNQTWNKLYGFGDTLKFYSGVKDDKKVQKMTGKSGGSGGGGSSY